MRVAVCSLATGRGHLNGLNRLRDSLKYHKVGWDQLFYFNCYPEGCPPHKDAPYLFKAHILMQAMKEGYDIVIWADAAVWLINPDVEPFIKHIEKTGTYFIKSGFETRTWTPDKMLERMGVKREDATFDMILACIMGFNLNHPRVKEFLYEYYYWCNLNKGELLQHDWTNDKGQVSSDPLCRGGRHDQSAGSILINKYKFPILIGHENFFQYYTKDYVGKNWKKDFKIEPKSTIMLTQGCSGEVW